MALLLAKTVPLLATVRSNEELWRTFSPSRHVRWVLEAADVFTWDEGAVPGTELFTIKPGAIDLRGDGASVWREDVLIAADVNLEDIVVGEYTGVLHATKSAIEECIVEKTGCDPEQPFRVVPDPYPDGQPLEPPFASHALVKFEPRQQIGPGAATSVLVRKAFRVLRMGEVPRAIANE